MVRISVLLERRCIAGEDGHFARTLKLICILILLPDSVRYYCKIERKSTILVQRRDKTKNRSGAGEISRKKKKGSREKKKCKSRSGPAVSNPHWQGTCWCGPVRARTVGALRLKQAEISVHIQHKFPVPHRQSPPSRLSNLNKTPLMTSSRKFRLRKTTRDTIHNEFCDLQYDLYMEKRAP